MVTYEPVRNAFRFGGAGITVFENRVRIGEREGISVLKFRGSGARRPSNCLVDRDVSSMS